MRSRTSRRSTAIPGLRRPRGGDPRGHAGGARPDLPGLLLDDGTWLGFADFLSEVDRPSDLGAWSYEVVDAKLTREAKATAMLQTCVYSDLIEGLQGLAAEGSTSTRGTAPDGFLPAGPLRGLLPGPEAALRGASGRGPDEPPVAPEPVDHCRICDWDSRCKEERRPVDHLSLVSGIAGDHRRALDAADFHAGGAGGSPPGPAPPGASTHRLPADPGAGPGPTGGTAPGRPPITSSLEMNPGWPAPGSGRAPGALARRPLLRLRGGGLCLRRGAGVPLGHLRHVGRLPGGLGPDPG